MIEAIFAGYFGEIEATILWVKQNPATVFNDHWCTHPKFLLKFDALSWCFTGVEHNRNATLCKLLDARCKRAEGIVIVVE